MKNMAPQDNFESQEEEALNTAFLFADLTLGSSYSGGLRNLANMNLDELEMKSRQLLAEPEEPHVLEHTISSLLVLLRDSESRSMRDSLTRMYNRNYLVEMVEFHLERVERGHGVGGGMIGIDLDGFKPINDTYGHQVGDQALILAGQTITGNVRGIDIAARMGGDEFNVFMPDASVHDVSAVTERLKEEFSALNLTVGSEMVSVQASIGMTLLEPQQTLAELFKAADDEMYKVKKAKPTARPLIEATRSEIQISEDNPAFAIK